MPSAMQSKQQLRRNFLQQRRHINPQKKQEIDQAIAQAVMKSEWFLQAHTIFIYYSTEEEIATHTLIQAGLAEKKCICLPKCLPNHAMEARRIGCIADLTEQSYGIPEPGAHCTVVTPDEIDLCLVPALACDRRGYRLGYGGGFYDRFLPRTTAKIAALCASARLIASLPTDRFDVPCSCIFTENEVFFP